MQKRIRILFTIPNFHTAGSGKSVYDLVAGLDREIFEPEVCCFHNRGAFFKEVESLGAPIHLFPFVSPYTPKVSFLRNLWKTRAFFRKHRYDIIHSWHWSSDISEPLAAKLAGIPYVYTKKAMGWDSRFWKWRSRLSSKIIAVNSDMVDAYFSTMVEKVEQFPLAIDVTRYQPMTPSNTLQKELGLLPDDFVIVSVANLVAVKGIETLLEAVKLLNEPKMKVIIVGDDSGTYAIDLKKRYKQFHWLTFVGKQLDVRPYIALADLFVIPTKDEGRREGIPNAPLEAMAMETIVLGSDITGIRDVLSVFPNSMFRADDFNDLASRIKSIKRLSEDEKKTLEQQMRRRVIDKFAIEDFINKHQALYLNLVNG